MMRIWARADAGDAPVWNGKLQAVLSGDAYCFGDWAALVAVLAGWSVCLAARVAQSRRHGVPAGRGLCALLARRKSGKPTEKGYNGTG